MKGQTKSGFKFELEEKRVSNYELFDLMAEVDDNTLVLPKMLSLLLGDEQKKRLMNHLRDEEGFISLEKVETEVKDILSGNDKVKN